MLFVETGYKIYRDKTNNHKLTVGKLVLKNVTSALGVNEDCLKTILI